MSRRKKQYPIALEVKFAPLPKEKAQAYLYAMEVLVGMLLRVESPIPTFPQMAGERNLGEGATWDGQAAGVERDGALMELG